MRFYFLYKRVHVVKRFTFTSLLPNKTYQKHFRLKTRLFMFTKELKLRSIIKKSKITCLEHHAIKIEIHAPMSHTIKALCPGVLQHKVP